MANILTGSLVFLLLEDVVKPPTVFSRFFVLHVDLYVIVMTSKSWSSISSTERRHTESRGGFFFPLWTFAEERLKLKSFSAYLESFMQHTLLEAVYRIPRRINP